jgi:Fe-S-cluster containining protein
VAGVLGESEALEHVREVLAAAEADVDVLDPHCRACGQCCDFQAAGHRLYVSTAELALLVSGDARQPDQPLRCPYQQGSACTARENRPLGCRVFFCDAALAASTQAVYERHHAELRQLHEAFGLPYFYVELTAGLSIYTHGL